MKTRHRPWLLLLAVASCWGLTLPAPAQQVSPQAKAKDAKPKAEAPVDLATELKQLQDVQVGLTLTLAACQTESYCVTGVNEQEMTEMQDRLQQVAQQLEQKDAATAQTSPEQKQAMLQELEALRARAGKLQASVTQAKAQIDESKLKGNWSDQFVFDDFNNGPSVPFPNDKVPLTRFEDDEDPLPIQ